MSAIETLREAAEKLRNLADAATPGRWMGTRLDGTVNVARMDAEFESLDAQTFSLVRPGTETPPNEAMANCEYIAAMHPGVGQAIADWLDQSADNLDRAWGTWRHAEENGHKGFGTAAEQAERVHSNALAVARAVLGETS